MNGRIRRSFERSQTQSQLQCSGQAQAGSLPRPSSRSVHLRLQSTAQTLQLITSCVSANLWIMQSSNRRCLPFTLRASDMFNPGDFEDPSFILADDHIEATKTNRSESSGIRGHNMPHHQLKRTMARRILPLRVVPSTRRDAIISRSNVSLPDIT